MTKLTYATLCDIRTFLNVRINGSNFAQKLVRRDLHFSRVITDYLMYNKLDGVLKRSPFQTRIEKFKFDYIEKLF